MSTGRRRVNGTVIDTDGEPNPHSFWIEGDDGNRYFAHLGDLEHNSGKLLRNESTDTMFLEENDLVEFEVWEPQENTRSAINVRRRT